MDALFVGLAVASLAAINFGIWYFKPDQQLRRLLKRTPVQPIAQVREGTRARIVGAVRPESATVEAPLSGRPCTYWTVIVQEKQGGHWVTIIEEHGGVDFLVEDPTGRARVATVHASALLQQDARYSSGAFRDASPALESFLRARGFSSEGWVFNKSIRYHEGVAEPGEEVAALGRGRWEDDPESDAHAGAGYRDTAIPKRLVMEALDDGSPLLLSDEERMLR